MPQFRGALALDEAWGIAHYLRSFVPGTEMSKPVLRNPPGQTSAGPGGTSTSRAAAGTSITTSASLAATATPPVPPPTVNRGGGVRSHDKLDQHSRILDESAIRPLLHERTVDGSHRSCPWFFCWILRRSRVSQGQASPGCNAPHNAYFHFNRQNLRKIGYRLNSDQSTHSSDRYSR